MSIYDKDDTIIAVAKKPNRYLHGRVSANVPMARRIGRCSKYNEYEILPKKSPALFATRTFESGTRNTTEKNRTDTQNMTPIFCHIWYRCPRTCSTTSGYSSGIRKNDNTNQCR